jgi:hypothetical protein
MGLEIVLALGIVGAILVFLFNSLRDSEGETHYALQIIVLGFLLWVIILLGKAAVDYNNTCVSGISNQTTVYNYLEDNVTINNTLVLNNYSEICFESGYSTATSLLKATLWITRLTALYLILSFAFELINYLGWWKRGGKQE